MQTNTLLKKILVLSLLSSFSIAGTQLSAAAPIVANGDFSTGASNFSNSPGYGDSSNGAIPDWTTNETIYQPGINGSGAPFNYFAPNSYSSSDPATYAFLQYVGNDPDLTQSISLTAGTTYTLSFYSAPRGGDSSTGAVEISNASVDSGSAYVTVAANGTKGTDFTLTSYTFTADAGTTGDSIITLLNSPSALDLANNSIPTEDFTGISIVPVTPVTTPEPRTFPLLGLGVLALLLLRGRGQKEFSPRAGNEAAGVR